MFSIKRMILIALALIMVVCVFAQTKDKMDLQANPNPMKEYTEITFTLDSAKSVNLVITDSKGIVLRTIFNGQLEKGKHGFGWDGSDYTNTRLPEGKYVIELNTDSKFTSVKKIIILK